jgi:hypothetical protein
MSVRHHRARNGPLLPSLLEHASRPDDVLGPLERAKAAIEEDDEVVPSLRRLERLHDLLVGTHPDPPELRRLKAELLAKKSM